jgi:hypothetical protein
MMIRRVNGQAFIGNQRLPHLDDKPRKNKDDAKNSPAPAKAPITSATDAAPTVAQPSSSVGAPAKTPAEIAKAIEGIITMSSPPPPPSRPRFVLVIRSLGCYCMFAQMRKQLVI